MASCLTERLAKLDEDHLSRPSPESVSVASADVDFLLLGNATHLPGATATKRKKISVSRIGQGTRGI